MASDGAARAMTEKELMIALVGAVNAAGRAATDGERLMSVGVVQMLLNQYVSTAVRAGMDAVLHAPPTGCGAQWREPKNPGRIHSCCVEAEHAEQCRCRCGSQRTVP